MELDREISKDSSTRESVVLTPWPPGPDEREKRSDSSAAGMLQPLVTRRSSAMASACRTVLVTVVTISAGAGTRLSATAMRARELSCHR